MKNSKTYFIAEAGVNHNGSLRRAKQLVDIAAKAGADAVKFQTFSADKLVTKSAPSASYQKARGQGNKQYQMLKRLELAPKDFLTLKVYCRKKRIDFLSTPFDLESLKFLVGTLKLKTIKISSGDLTNAPLLLAAARANIKIILSTGMATMQEIETALGVLCFGFDRGSNRKIPSAKNFKSAFRQKNVRKILAKKIVLLHCTTEYPAPEKDINLRAMQTLGNFFSVPVGYSDHSIGLSVSTAAVALGATVIEKHFTVSKKLPGPDHPMSLDAKELTALIRYIREVEKALGSPQKRPTPSELKNKKICTKSIVTLKPIRKGERFSEKNLTTKRPGSGTSPLHFWDYLGKTAKRNYPEDSLL